MRILALLIFSQFFLVNARASVRIGDWLIDQSGRPDAIPYPNKSPEELCGAVDGRLPTPREIANWASRPCSQIIQVNCGAKGIRETRFPNLPATSQQVQQEADSMPTDFVGIGKSKPDQPGVSFVDFYFSGSGFQLEPKQRYTPDTIITSGFIQELNHNGGIATLSVHFIPEPRINDDYFGYGYQEDFLIQGGLRCAFDE